MSSTSKLLTPQWRILPSRSSVLNGLERFVQRHAAAPVQQIHVEPVGLQPPKARLARGNRAAPGRVLRHHLADEEDLAAAIGQRFGDELLSRAVAVHLRRIDHRHARGRPPSAARRSHPRAFFRLSPMFQVPIPSAGMVSPPGAQSFGCRPYSFIIRPMKIRGLILGIFRRVGGGFTTACERRSAAPQSTTGEIVVGMYGSLTGRWRLVRAVLG